MVPDSPLYLTFAPRVTATYPWFVAAVGVENLVAVQLLLYAAAAGVLAITIHRLYGSPLMALAMLIALFINPEIYGFQTTVLSEGLFLPVSLLFLAALLTFIERHGVAAAVGAAALAGLSATIRPVTLPLIAVVVIVALLLPAIPRGRRFRLLALIMISWAAIVGAEKLYSHLRHGEASTSLAGPHLFAKGALVDTPPLDLSDLDPVERRLAERAEVDYEPVRRLLDRARPSVAYPALLAFYEVCFQHGCAQPLRAEAGVPEAEFNRAMMRVGLLRLRANLPAYGRLTIDEYVNLWAVNSRTHPSRAAGFDSFVASERPLPLESLIQPQVLQPTQASPVAYVVRPAFIAAGVLIALLVIVFGLLILLKRSTTLIIAGFAAGLSVQLIFLFNALVGIGDGRYTMGMWPTIALSLLIGAVVILRILMDRFTSGKRRVG